MNNKKGIIIAITSIVAVILLFAGVIKYALYQKNNDRGRTLVSITEYLGLEKKTAEEDDLEQAIDGSYELIDVSDMIYTIDDVDMEQDDFQTHDIEVEDTYVNTLELLPSTFNQRERVYKSRVNTENFPEAYAIKEQKRVEIMDMDVLVPKEVHLYNNCYEKSSSYEVKLNVEDSNNRVVSLGWTCEDADVIALSNTSGARATVSAINPNFSGRTTITITVKYRQSEDHISTEIVTFDLYVDGISFSDNQLKDTDGNELYLDLEGVKEACVSDYGRYDYFYGAVKTTGWQDINGIRYYYDHDSTFVTGKQIIGGVPYEFNQDGALISKQLSMGIDVSKWQKEIDWQQVAASGIDFAIIRCGFRGAASGLLVEDPYFKKNIEGAKAAGLSVGVYFFTQAINEREACEEASMAISMCQGYDLELPIYIDTEKVSSGRANGLSADVRTKCMKAFCETVNANGNVGGVYASKSWFYNQLNASELEQYNIWVAQYNTECNYRGKTDFWQYSSKEHIAGIEGYVDVDVVRSVP